MEANLLARQRERQSRRTSRSLYHDLHDGPRSAAQGFDRLVRRPPARRAAVDLDDPIAGHDAGALRRGSRQRRDHGDGPIAHVHLDAHSRITTRGTLVQLREPIGREVHGVWVVQLEQQAVHRLPVQIVFVDGVHKGPLDAGEHLIEQSGSRRWVDGRPRVSGLHEPATRNERAGKYRGDHYCT